jgi:hypothetical protein
MRTWEVIAKCNNCHAEKIKRKSEYNLEKYLCIHCFRQKQGKKLGDKFGKSQEYKGSCRSCKTPLPTSLKWCDKCQDKKKETLKKRMSGTNNPVWTGNSICECGEKKDTTAKQCRTCSFKSGMRSGTNNGRYVTSNREEFLVNQKSRKIARNMLSNYLKAKGLKKKFKSEKILGYTFYEFRKHIENLMESWMNWDNYGLGQGKWNIDHIIPLKKLSELGITEPHVVNALINLRPMCSIENIKKSDSIIDDLQYLVEDLFKLKGMV